MIRMFRLVFLLLLGCGLFSCSHAIEPNKIKSVDGARQAPVLSKQTALQFSIVSQDQAHEIVKEGVVYGPQKNKWRSLASALKRSRIYLRKRPQDQLIPALKQYSLQWGDLSESLDHLLEILPRLENDPSFLAKEFVFLALQPKTLLTGYYEPWLNASLTKSKEYPYPLYGLPPDYRSIDLGKFNSRWNGERLVYRQGKQGIEPYHDRRAIDDGHVLDGTGAEIAYARTLMDVFLLQIQGSGRLVLPDGSVRHILYAGKNGHPYVSIGKLLIQEGHIPKSEMSMTRIRKFMDENPVLGREVMFRNPNYVFFRMAETGPYGSLGQVLTPMVSVAVDRSVIPLGSALFLLGTIPQSGGGLQPFQSLVTAQDTGGAIQKTRCDLFCGTGMEAESIASNLQHPASLYILISKKIFARRHMQ